MSTEDDQPAAGSLRSAMIKGSLWMVASRWLVRAIGLVSTVILARLLMPDDFGIVALAMLVVGFVEVLLLFGVDLALIQNRNATADHFDTAWTLRILQGVIVWALLILATPFAREILDDPRLAFVIPLLGFGVFVKSLENIGTVAFRKELDFAKEFRFRVLQKLSMFVVTVTLAIVTRNYWALVVGILGGSTLGTLLSYRMHPYRPKISLKAVREIWGFSQWMLAINIINYANDRSGDVIVGAFSSTQNMGVYSVSLEIALLPTTEIVFPVSRALYPGYAKIAHDPGRMKAAYLNVLGVVSTLVVASGIGLSLVAGEVVPLFLGDKWLAAIPVIQFLALFGALRATYGTVGNVFVAVGRLNVLTWLTLVETAMALSLGYVGLQAHGIVGLAAARVAVAAPFFFVFFLALTRVIRVGFLDLAAVMFRPLAAGFAMCAAVLGVGAVLPPGTWPTFLLKTAVGACVFCGVLLLIWRVQGRPDGIEHMAFERVGAWLRKR